MHAYSEVSPITASGTYSHVRVYRIAAPDSTASSPSYSLLLPARPQLRPAQTPASGRPGRAGRPKRRAGPPRGRGGQAEERPRAAGWPRSRPDGDGWSAPPPEHSYLRRGLVRKEGKAGSRGLSKSFRPRRKAVGAARERPDGKCSPGGELSGEGVREGEAHVTPCQAPAWVQLGTRASLCLSRRASERVLHAAEGTAESTARLPGPCSTALHKHAQE